MGKLLVLAAGALTIATTTSAYAEPMAVDLVAIEQPMMTYDACLAAASLRAQRARAPIDLWHDLSKRSCEDVRASLLNGPNADPVLVAALDAVDKTRLAYIEESRRGLASEDVAHEGNSRRLDMLSWMGEMAQLRDDARLVRRHESRPVTQPEPQPQRRN